MFNGKAMKSDSKFSKKYRALELHMIAQAKVDGIILPNPTPSCCGYLLILSN